jgi:hypothetical protein
MEDCRRLEGSDRCGHLRKQNLFPYRRVLAVFTLAILHHAYLHVYELLSYPAL